MSKGISYHNKDILFKFLNELYKDATLDVLKLDFPKIVQLLPNEFPEVTADEKRLDTVFLLEDGSILMLEYESNTRFVENHFKYIQYVQRITQRFYREENQIKQVRIVVFYTSDVKKVKSELNLGDLIIASTPVLLHEYNGDAIMDKIKDKLSSEEPLSSEDFFQLSILPLMNSKKDRNELIKDSIELAKQLPDEKKQVQTIAGILASTDKFIDEEYARKVREWLKMTKVARIFEEEKQEAVKLAKREEKLNLARNLIGVLELEVIAEKTGLSLEEVKELEREENERRKMKRAY